MRLKSILILKFQSKLYSLVKRVFICVDVQELVCSSVSLTILKYQTKFNKEQLHKWVVKQKRIIKLKAVFYKLRFFFTYIVGLPDGSVEYEEPRPCAEIKTLGTEAEILFTNMLTFRISVGLFWPPGICSVKGDFGVACMRRFLWVTRDQFVEGRNCLLRISFGAAPALPSVGLWLWLVARGELMDRVVQELGTNNRYRRGAK